jgi:trk system potassium uptake protein TrkA
LGDLARRLIRSDERGDVLVVGLGRFGSSLAHTLIELGHQVLVVDMSADLVQRHAGEFTHAVQGDATSTDVLRQLGAQDMAIAAVCIGTDVEASILSTAALSDLGVRSIWAKAITSAHGKILSRVGAHHVVFPEAEMGCRVAHLLAGRILEYVELDSDFVLAEMPVPRSFVGINLANTKLRARHHITVVCVKHVGEQFTYATADTVLAADDLVVIAGHRRHVDQFVADT